MKLIFSGDNPYTHGVLKSVVLEKDISDFEEMPASQEVQLVYGSLRVTDIRTALEFLNDRYPFPPLLPVEPIAAARVRLTMNYILGNLDNPQSLVTLLSEMTRFVRPNSYILGDKFTLLDVLLVPLVLKHRTSQPEVMHYLNYVLSTKDSVRRTWGGELADAM